MKLQKWNSNILPSQNHTTQKLSNCIFFFSVLSHNLTIQKTIIIKFQRFKTKRRRKNSLQPFELIQNSKVHIKCKVCSYKSTIIIMTMIKKIYIWKVLPGSFGLLVASSLIVLHAPFLEPNKPRNSLSMWQKNQRP